MNFKRMYYLLLIPIVCYLGACLFLYYYQERFLFFPTKLAQNYQFLFPTPFEEVFIKTKDEATIHGLHFKADKPKGVILYFHGNAGNLQSWGQIAPTFLTQDYDVFIVDYRGYGKSTGTFNESILYDDAMLCYQHCQKQYSDNQIIIYGRSLGTTVACQLAAKTKAQQLILETPIYNGYILAKNHMPVFPVRLLMRYGFRNDLAIQDVNCPIHIFHGTADEVVPYNHSIQLLKAKDASDSILTTIDNGRHNNLGDYPEYYQKLQELLNRQD